MTTENNNCDAVLRICGARGTRQVYGQQFSIYGTNTNCYALKYGTHGIMIDCGSGFLDGVSFLSECQEIDVLLTHFHLDHISGFLSSPGVSCKDRRVRFHGHAEGMSIKDAFNKVFTPPFWPVGVESLGIEFVDLVPGDTLKLGDNLRIETMAGNHPGGSVLYNILINNKKISMIFDYEHNENFSTLYPFAKDANLLFYDGTLADEEYEAFKGWGHSTWQRAVMLAKAASAKELLITHHSARRDDDTLVALETLVQKEFSRCSFAREGKEYFL